MTDEHHALRTIVNRSGFPLQIKIADEVAKTKSTHGWSVLYQEHAWSHPTTDDSGFIDLVLQGGAGHSVLVVECKRVTNKSWIFLVPSDKARLRSHCKAWVTLHENQSVREGWSELQAEPPTVEAMFCVFDDNSRSLLESDAARLVCATEGLAREERKVLTRLPFFVRVYVNVIVTTAKLFACKVEPEQISLIDGTSSKNQFEEVPYLRFRKQFATASPDFHAHISDLGNLEARKENTVWVVNANAFVEFLSQFEHNDAWRG
ncbi:MAG TPA: hypothetical protein VGH80_10910 [Xanthomonadaceae bacterium]|jgi:hypothetical protein